MSSNMKVSKSQRAIRLLPHNKSSEKAGLECRLQTREKSAQKPTYMNSILDKPKPFVRKYTLKDKVSSMREKTAPCTDLYGSAVKPETERERPRKISLNAKRELIGSFNTFPTQTSMRKISDETAVDMAHSSETHRSTDKQTVCRDAQAKKCDYFTLNRGPKLSNLLNVINTDKELQDHRLHFRVG